MQCNGTLFIKHDLLHVLSSLGGGIQGMHYGGAPSFHIGQPHHLLQPQMPHLHNALPGGLAPAAMNPGSQPQQGIASNSGPAGQNGGNGTGTMLYFLLILVLLSA